MDERGLVIGSKFTDLHVINKTDVTLADGKLIVDASTAGLPPGIWPDFIAVVDDNGEGFLFGPVRRKMMASDGEIIVMIYYSRGPLELHIVND